MPVEKTRKGLTLKRHSFGLWLVFPAIRILIFSIALPLTCYVFGTKNASLRIQATVLHRQELKIIYQVPSITVTSSDIQKGCLDIPAAAKLSIDANNQSGHALLFEGLGWPFSKALIQGLDREIQVSFRLYAC